jgi:hypothetical protein
MPTLGEACQQLRIGRVTLTKWMKRLDIAATRHEYDWRFTVIAPEDVERIAEARRKLPQTGRSGVTGANISSYSLPAFDRRPARDETANDASPTVRASPRQRPLQRATFSELPDGMMSKEDASRLHNVPTTTLRRWCADGRIETTSGQYPGEGGRYGVVDPLTRRGLAQLYQLASQRADFTACPSCPHSTEDAQLAE